MISDKTRLNTEMLKKIRDRERHIEMDFDAITFNPKKNPNDMDVLGYFEDVIITHTNKNLHFSLEFKSELPVPNDREVEMAEKGILETENFIDLKTAMELMGIPSMIDIMKQLEENESRKNDRRFATEEEVNFCKEFQQFLSTKGHNSTFIQAPGYLLVQLSENELRIHKTTMNCILNNANKFDDVIICPKFDEDTDEIIGVNFNCIINLHKKL